MPLILGVATAAPHLYGAFKQAIAAGKVKKQDTTPAAFREKLALDQQAAAAGVMPGQAGQQPRLLGIQAGAVQNARLGAASGSDFLAASSAADSRRLTGEQQLGVQAGQYTDRARAQLGVSLNQQASYQKADADAYVREKAALKQASAENLNNAVQGAASYAAYGMNQAKNTVDGRAGAGMLGGETLTPLTVGVRNTAVSYTPPATLPYAGNYEAPSANGVQGLRRPRYAGYGIGGYPSRRIGL